MAGKEAAPRVSNTPQAYVPGGKEKQKDTLVSHLDLMPDFLHKGYRRERNTETKK